MQRDLPARGTGHWNIWMLPLISSNPPTKLRWIWHYNPNASAESCARNCLIFPFPGASLVIAGAGGTN